MKKSSLLFTFLVSFLFAFSSPQDIGADEHFQKDTARINKFIKQAKKILYINSDSTEILVDTIFELSTKIDYQFGLYNTYNLKANILIMSGRNMEAIKYLKYGFGYCDTLKDPRGKAVLLINLGFCYLSLSEADSAIHYYNLAYNYSLRNGVNDIRNKVMYDLGLLYLDKSNYLEAYRKIAPVCDTFRQNNDTLRMILSYGSMGVLYTKLGNFDSAYAYYTRANKLDAYYAYFDNMVNGYNNIGELYFRVRNEYDSALSYYRKSLRHKQQSNDNYYKSSSLINIGNVFYEKSKYDSAYYYYSMAENDTLIQYFPHQYTAVLINIGEYYRKKKSYVNSRNYLENGISIAQANGLIEYLSVGYLNLSRLDSNEGKWFNSLHNYKIFKEYADSLSILADKNEVSKIALDNYISKQKYDNQLLLTENTLHERLIRDQKTVLLVSLASLFLVLLVLIIMFVNRRKIKRLLKELSNKNTDLEKLTEELKTSNDDLNTERKNLKEANITKDKFLSILSHDLRGPFHSLLGILQLMDTEWEAFPDKEKKENVHMLYQSASNTLNLLEDLLLWGQAQKGALIFQPEGFNVCEQLESIIELYLTQASNKDIDITLDIPRDLTVVSDPRFFTQIMQNLLNNAIKFSYRGGEITIEYSKEGINLDFCVRDEGIGIPKDKLGDIFRITSNYRRTGTEDEKSTGMGLILCKEYAEIIDAKLTVSSIVSDPENDKPGGSIFCLRLTSKH